MSISQYIIVLLIATMPIQPLHFNIGQQACAIQPCDVIQPRIRVMSWLVHIRSPRAANSDPPDSCLKRISEGHGTWQQMCSPASRSPSLRRKNKVRVCAHSRSGDGKESHIQLYIVVTAIRIPVPLPSAPMRSAATERAPRIAPPKAAAVGITRLSSLYMLPSR